MHALWLPSLMNYVVRTFVSFIVVKKDPYGKRARALQYGQEVETILAVAKDSISLKSKAVKRSKNSIKSNRSHSEHLRQAGNLENYTTLVR